MYKIERTQEIDEELGVLWEDIKIIDIETTDYMLFRKLITSMYKSKNKYRMQKANIKDTKFYFNDHRGFTKAGKGKIKKEVESKLGEILDWTYDNIEELRDLGY